MNDQAKSKQSVWLKLLILVVLVMLGLLAWQSQVGMNSMFGRSNWPAKFSSNGERIYFTATSASGSLVSSRGGAMGTGMGMMGSAGGCVSCHGVERQGGRLAHRFWKSAPAITTEALFGEHDDDGHGDHDAYDEETLKRAITMGIDAGGKPLDQDMPRWTMSPADLDDLVAYLKTSKS